MAPRANGERDRHVVVFVVSLSTVRTNILRAVSAGGVRSAVQRAGGGKKDATNNTEGRHDYRWSDHLRSDLCLFLHSNDGRMERRLNEGGFEQRRGWSRQSLFRSPHQGRHFVGSDVVQAIAGTVIEEPVDLPVELFHDRTEEDGCVLFSATMGVNFDEHPFGASLNPNADLDPRGKAFDGREVARRIVDGGIFETW